MPTTCCTRSAKKETKSGLSLQSFAYNCRDNVLLQQLSKTLPIWHDYWGLEHTCVCLQNITNTILTSVIGNEVLRSGAHGMNCWGERMA